MYRIFSLSCLLLLFLLCGCPRKPVEEPPSGTTFEKVPAADLSGFLDDLDEASLKTALGKSLGFYEKAPGDRLFPLGDLQVRADLLKATLVRFLDLLETGRLDPRSIAKSFDVYRARAVPSLTNALVTGYYEPILDGTREMTPQFLCPLYELPSDLLTVDLAAFDPARFPGERLIGRREGNRVVPYYTRWEIDSQKKLGGAVRPLVWLQDPVDVFFLHIQGSGMIRLPDGRFRRVGYAGSNGRPYRSVGKLLVEKGLMGLEDVTMQSIRSYLRQHPEARDEILGYNESYVFFRWVEEGPVGSIGVVLTAGRSIATDTRYHPRGALAFLEAEKPRMDAGDRVVGREPLRRWVLNQDTGGAIKGVGRVDLFCGSGEEAGSMAGRLKYPGRLYFLIKKEGAD